MEQLVSLLNLAPPKTAKAGTTPSQTPLQESEEAFQNSLDDAFEAIELHGKEGTQINAKAVVASRHVTKQLAEEKEIRDIKDLKDIKDIVRLSGEKKLNLKSLTVEIKQQGEPDKKLVIRREEKTEKPSEKLERHASAKAVDTDTKPSKSASSKSPVDLKELISRLDNPKEESGEAKSGLKAAADNKADVVKSPAPRETKTALPQVKKEPAPLEGVIQKGLPAEPEEVTEKGTEEKTRRSVKEKESESRRQAEPSKEIKAENTPRETKETPSAGRLNPKEAEQTVQAERSTVKAADDHAAVQKEQGKPQQTAPASHADPEPETLHKASPNANENAGTQIARAKTEPLSVDERKEPKTPKELKGSPTAPKREEHKTETKPGANEEARPGRRAAENKSDTLRDSAETKAPERKLPEAKVSQTQQPADTRRAETADRTPGESKTSPRQHPAQPVHTAARSETAISLTAAAESVKNTPQEPVTTGPAAPAQPEKSPAKAQGLATLLNRKAETPNRSEQAVKEKKPATTQRPEPASPARQQTETAPLKTGSGGAAPAESPSAVPETDAIDTLPGLKETPLRKKTETKVSKEALNTPQTQVQATKKEEGTQETPARVQKEQLTRPSVTLSSLISAQKAETKEKKSHNSAQEAPSRTAAQQLPLAEAPAEELPDASRELLSRIVSQNISASAAGAVKSDPVQREMIQQAKTGMETALESVTQNENGAEDSVQEVGKQDDIKTDTVKSRVASARATVNHFVNDMKEQIENYRAPLMKITLDLNPKNLGSVGVTLLNRGKNLHVQIHSNNQAIQLFMQNHADFRNALSDLGYKDVQLNFSSGQGSSANHNGGGQGSYREQQQSPYSGPEHQDNDTQTDEMEIILPNLIYG